MALNMLSVLSISASWHIFFNAQFVFEATAAKIELTVKPKLGKGRVISDLIFDAR
jgi:hypothetical protein